MKRLILLFFLSMPLGCVEQDYQSSLVSDFLERDQLPQTDVPRDDWNKCCGSWGPWPSLYPAVQVPIGVEVRKWRSNRFIAVAKKYIGLPYQHHHIPSMGGLDCSNFTAWVYNYGFGIFLDSNIQKQSATAGRLLMPEEALIPGDLIFIWNTNRSHISHVSIYISEQFLIDSTGPGVQIRNYSGWYRKRFAWARRILD